MTDTVQVNTPTPVELDLTAALLAAKAYSQAAAEAARDSAQQTNAMTLDVVASVGRGQPNGVAPLDSLSRVPVGNMPEGYLASGQSAAVAIAAASAAEVARDATFTAGHIFATTTAGLAATAVGGYFSIPAADPDYFVLYRADAGGVATAVKTFGAVPAQANLAEARAGLVASRWMSPAATAAALTGRWGSVAGALDELRFEGCGYAQAVVGANRAVVEFVDASGLRRVLQPTVYANLNGGEPLDGARFEGSGVAYGVVGQNRMLLFAPPASAASAPVRLAYALDDGTGRTAIWSESVATGERLRLSSPGANETAPTPDGFGAVIWKSDRAGGAPGGLYFSRLDGVGGERAALPLRTLACWGDSLTAQNWMTYLADAGCDAPYWNFGRSGDTPRAVAARMGAISTTFTVAGGAIPAAGAVGLTLDPYSRGDPTLKFGGANTAVAGWLGGVFGTLTRASNVFSFTRDAAGGAVAVTSADFVWAMAPLGDANPADAAAVVGTAREATQIFFMGRNDATGTAATLQYFRLMVAAIQSYTRRFIVIPFLPRSTEVAGTGGASDRAALVAACAAEWPQATLDLLPAFLAAGNGSPEDTADVAAGVPPRSLLQADGLHPNAAGKAVIAAAVAAHIATRGLL